MSFIHINSGAGDCKEWIPFTHRAQDGFNYICVLSLTLPSTSLDQVYQVGHNVKYLVWEKLLLLFVAAAQMLL